jgi:hypothetical protein
VLQSSMEQLVVHEGAAKRDIWKQKVKNLSDEYHSLHKSWEKDARRLVYAFAGWLLHSHLIGEIFEGLDSKSKKRRIGAPSSPALAEVILGTRMHCLVSLILKRKPP